MTIPTRSPFKPCHRPVSLKVYQSSHSTFAVKGFRTSSTRLITSVPLWHCTALRNYRARPSPLTHHPLAAPLDELVQHHADIRERKATHEKAKELGSMFGAEFQANMRLGGKFEAWVLRLSCDLVCPTIHQYFFVKHFLTLSNIPMICAASHSRASAAM